MQNPESPPTLEPNSKPAGRRLGLVQLYFAVLLGIIVLSVVAGVFSGRQVSAENERILNLSRVTEQFGIALQDLQQGQFVVAATRLAYIQTVVPDFPGLQPRIDEANLGMNATPTLPPTATRVPSPTPDVSRGEQLLNKAQQQFKDADYRGMYTTLLGLKAEVPAYLPVRVDGLIWTALRYEGITLINNSQLNEGAYYLDLAKNYAPLDSKAAEREAWSQIVLLGYQQAYVYLAQKDYPNAVASFEQILILAPGYRTNLQADYIELLKEYGDNLLKSGENVCLADELFEKALAYLPEDAGLMEQRDKAYQQCNPPVIPTVEIVPTPTL